MSLTPEQRALDDFQSVELGGFLRNRRERLTPATVGLQAGPRRRAIGLRREEVAVLPTSNTLPAPMREQR